VAVQAQLRWQPTPIDVDNMARICHEANRALCTVNGDLSQPPWDDAPEWQQESARDGVRFHIEQPYADSKASHDRWLEVKLKDGWRYGPTKDAANKVHPCLLPYHALPPHEQIKDDIFTSIVHGYLQGMKRAQQI
jgi:hypothetical protein